MKIAVIGAGMAGLSCAQALSAAGHAVQVLDKGRGPGGRMSTRRTALEAGEVSFDHGAQFFTVRDPAFAERAAAWVEAGVAAPWPAAGPEAMVGVPGMNAPIRAMAQGLDVTWQARVDEIARAGEAWRLGGEGFAPLSADAVVVATPSEQAAALLAEVAPDMAAQAAAVISEPCWTVMAAFAAPLTLPDVVREAGPLAWAARNSAKPGRTGPEAWVLQASPDWSRDHLEDAADTVAEALLDLLAKAEGQPLPARLSLQAHRWRYARTTAQGGAPLWSAEMWIGACGDWLARARVEAAWRSGHDLAGLMLAAS
ncbi:NAD(P)/FAD-dependent oxidoreductase [Phenylobacterium sp.]|uniref:NAD(P)/FAD-dependent oxidoreductase n=1 Tax=Phenylobacterium sp. TaxID=1871053 RepID=UPI00272F3882|nr:FAD-dependent oxidoreductase [Phenylobacterium sp.]MDP1874157.1 FAD-dependent oxidoreductase [Phenylobacterium sp.]